MTTGMIVLIVVVVLVVLLLIYVASTYNKLVDLRNRVHDQWSQIDVQLKRRFDLIPNLVNTVKGYAKHEEKTLEQVIEARNNYNKATTQDEKMAANNELSQTLSHLFAVAENYPDLKANTNFLELQTELQDTENKIAMARQFYNDTVLTLNNKIEMFPSNIIAGLFHFKKEEFFQAVEEERENVKVEF
ncbi:TPA: LemA family protein [Candidatus Ventrenecus avicola]|nr:LemA family protein [Candidatus Ventrenecus avicola]